MGAKSATVMAWLSSPIPAYAVPTETIAVTIGRMLAASEPKARKRTTAATTTPTISLRCAELVSVSAAALPPTATWRPSAEAAFAVSTTARAWASGISSAGRSKVTEA